MNDLRTPVKTLTISTDSADQRIDNYLFSALKALPKSHVYRLLRKGEIRVNKKRIGPDYRLQPGDCLRLPPMNLGPTAETPHIPETLIQTLKQSILYEDNHLLIINKPQGLAVHGGTGVKFGLIEAVRHLYPELTALELAHRLDKETSGVLVLAKDRTTLLALHQAFKERTADKYYRLWVVGRWPEKLKRIQVSIEKAGQDKEKRMRVSETGQTAVTHFKVLQYWQGYTCLEAKLETGRTHQIRLHTASQGCPIVGDEKYGSHEANRQAKKMGFKGMQLHAECFKWSYLNKTFNIRAPLPLTWFKAN